MKKNDIAMLILIASISLLVAYFVAQALLGNPSKKSATVKTVEAISTDVVQPDETVFGKDSINPTYEVSIGNSANQLPF